MDADVSDFLEAVFLNENRCQDEGFAEGKRVGRTRGLEAGYRLGCLKGGEIGSELGFYQGFACACRPLAEQQQKPRVHKTMESLLRLIEQFPLLEPNTPTIQEQLDNIRAKFKQMTSLLGIEAHFVQPDAIAGTSF